ncbi:MAG TPA: bacteriohopanetetrol glucosamine biosynthesis glycosyltransferase HpnI [Stellaceae bacterium]|nr:bacteriohopanetetrol glucosamine biosynthesis glycosyltransferase HpnI [Stellaceae bacterium]
MALNGMDILALALVLASAGGCVYLGLSLWAVRRLVRARARAAVERPAVSVLKPLCGEDADLAANLASFCRQDYPEFQIVFGVSDGNDPAIPVVRRLMAAFPAADLTLVIDPKRRGRNLKVANLHNMLPAARHGILVLADSDMSVGPGYLDAVTAPLADRAVGIVTCLYRGVPAGGVWSRLACLHVNHGFLPQAALAEAIGAGAGCFGATIALRRDMLERIGGLAAIEDALADDYALGAAVRRQGGRIELSSHLVDNVIAEPSLTALFRHELRWARTIRLVAPRGFAGSVVTQPVMLAALAAALGALPWVTLPMLAAALAWRCVTVRALDRILGLAPSPLHLVPARDLLSFAVFVASFFARRVAWRDRTFRVGRGGELTLDGDSPA